MMPLTAAHLRALADQLDQEEADAKAKLEQAETAEEREAIRKEIADLRDELAKVKEERAELDRVEDESAGEGNDSESDSGDSDEVGERRKRKTRPGRKRGQLYQDAPGEAGYIYDGEDEPDEVEIDEETG